MRPKQALQQVEQKMVELQSQITPLREQIDKLVFEFDELEALKQDLVRLIQEQDSLSGRIQRTLGLVQSNTQVSDEQVPEAVAQTEQSQDEVISSPETETSQNQSLPRDAYLTIRPMAVTILNKIMEGDHLPRTLEKALELTYGEEWQNKSFKRSVGQNHNAELTYAQDINGKQKKSVIKGHLSASLLTLVQVRLGEIPEGRRPNAGVNSLVEKSRKFSEEQLLKLHEWWDLTPAR